MTTLPDPRTQPLLKVAEVASYLPDGISDKAVRAAIDAGQIAHVRVGRYVLVPTVELYRLAGLNPHASEVVEGKTSAASETMPIGQKDGSNHEPNPLRVA